MDLMRKDQPGEWDAFSLATVGQGLEPIVLSEEHAPE